MDKIKKYFKIIVSVIVIICIYKIYTIYSAIRQIQAIGSMGLQYAVDTYKKPNSEDIPAFAKKFRVNDNYEKDLFTFFNGYRFDSNSKDEEKQKKYKESFENLKYKLTFNLDEFKNELIPSILTRLNDNQPIEFPSYEERRDFPVAPEHKTFENTAKYWVFVSRIFEEQGDYDSSLLLFQGIFYLLVDYETQYRDNYFPLYEMDIADLACDSILVWASKAKPQNRVMSKKVANALLKFAKNDYPFTDCIKNKKTHFEKAMQHSLDNGYHPALKTINKTKKLEDALNIIFEEPIKQLDKPYLEIKDYLKAYTNRKKEADNFNRKAQQGPLGILNPTFLLYPERSVYEDIIGHYGTDLNLFKRAYEHKLGKIEFTAIALLINVYYCENDRLPKSIEELSQWYGQELPKDRSTNEDYKIEENNWYTMFCNGIYPLVPFGIYDEDSKDEEEAEMAKMNQCYSFKFLK